MVLSLSLIHIFSEHGFDGFAEHEVLEMLLYYAIPRRDTNPLAHSILNEYNSIANVFEADVSELAKLPGLSESSATLLSMVPHLSRVYEKSKCDRDNLLHDTESIGQYAVSLLKGKVNEEFALICLDANRRVHWSGIIAKGTIDRIDAVSYTHLDVYKRQTSLPFFDMIKKKFRKDDFLA